MIKEHHENITKASEKMKTFLQETKYEADVISGLTIAGQGFRGLGDLLGTAEEITDFVLHDIEDAPKNSNEKTKLKKAKKRKGLSQASRGLKIAAGVSGMIGSIMDIAVTAQQMKLAQKEFDEQMTGLEGIDQSTEKYRNAVKKRQQSWNKKETFQMTLSTQ